ncbi:MULTISPECIES: HAD-IIIA family hydrolase [unclassified Leptolyngbya]|uniref:HAD-IIIA family hydrolase n=1 Tax=unclassified Leptolyngbya TaxID=2650499 RepID=UPI001687AE88|nr:HAD family hydrolase [Leptolyngbya sp. FACHB-8]MBD2153991.1 HAD family hydrolase [Leptolyngbya sp. FACHB-16]
MEVGWAKPAQPHVLKPAVFLDKDGTLIVDVPYNVDPEQIQLQPGAASAVQRLHQAGYALVVVSNQSGVARGYFAEAALKTVEQRLQELLGVPLAGFYYCPHYPTGVVPEYAIACSCRKPEPGMLLQAAADLHLDMSRSWMIGDILNDVEAAHRAGCCAILIDNGNETEWEMTEGRSPDFTAPDMAIAANFILHQAKDDDTNGFDADVSRSLRPSARVGDR